ncbi:DUF4231 domain-containing protein [Phormidium yuhuli AB48]|uniref:DUF4231 domain-containing protein n=1 Tax=Phormidium yuhuli AB48 TaxID=2940671 RepID=A0ABY5AU78_9CYAN|nr:DUF4231 domain-containing protein [Phormidium yuhuli]USR91683.1 DUF4231 domain-containing protein [Phormidium yuhuli AB48]
MAKKKKTYNDYLKEQFGGLIDQLEISDLQKEFVKSRWLDQLMWLEKKSGESQKKHFRLRLITIIGGVVIPAMVSLNVRDGPAKDVIFWGTFSLAQVVAISASVEEFFHYGERWTQYRKTAEMLKTEGWQYFQLSGPYRDSSCHSSAYRSFADRVEHLIQEDVSAITAVLEEAQQQQGQRSAEASSQFSEMAQELGRSRPLPPPPPPRPQPPVPAQRRASVNEPSTLPRYDDSITRDPFGDDFGDEVGPTPAPITSQPPRSSRSSGKAHVTAPPPPEINDPKLQNLKAPPGEPISPRAT